MHARDSAIKVGDATDHRWPGLGRKVLIRSVVTTRMETQAAAMVHTHYSTTKQIGFNDGPVDQTRDCKQPSCGLLRPGRHRRTTGFRDDLRFRAGQLQEPPRFLGYVAEVTKPKTLADDVEEITMLAGCGVCLMCNCT